MEILRFSASLAERIGYRPYDVKLASSIEIAKGEGEAHAYVLYLEAGGVIGPHEAGFGQIFFAAAGSGWVAGPDNQRVVLSEGEAAFISRGEVHSKGSEAGMTALMVQVRDLAARVGQQPDEPTVSDTGDHR
jgi:quercetin dioxygenase-like cupin family protein